MLSDFLIALAAAVRAYEDRRKYKHKRRQLIKQYGQCSWCGGIYEPNEPLQHIHTYRCPNFPQWADEEAIVDE